LALRSPGNEENFRGLLSLLCQTSGPDGGSGLFPLQEIPVPIQNGLRELLQGGTTNQKLGILAFIQRNAHSGPQGLDLIGQQALVDQCTALLGDSDPRLRVSAAGMLQTVAPLREDRRVEVLQEVWQTSAENRVRCHCLSVLGTMNMWTPEAREFLLKGMSQIASDGTLAQDAELGGAVLWAMRTGTWSDLRPEVEEMKATICSSALRTVSTTAEWDAWLGISLDLPLTRLVPIL